MAQSFTPSEWKKIHTLLDDSGEGFGLPRRSSGSLVIGSFNIRKLGAVSSKSKGAWETLARIAAPFDLLAVQEVQENLDGLNHLVELLGDDRALIASDATGPFPGDGGAGERLAFVYRPSRVRRTEIASDVTYDRSKIVETLVEQRAPFGAAFEAHATALADWATKKEQAKAAGKKAPDKPTIQLPAFLTFIRQPHCVSFEAGWSGTQKPYRFLAVNVHLLFGEFPVERRMEFFALMRWLLAQARVAADRYYPDMLMLGDCNLDFDDPAEDRPLISDTLKQLNTFATGKRAAELNFPFLDVHPTALAVYRTNARLDETFDQIAIIRRDKRFPTSDANTTAGTAPDGFDYGVVDFVNLFAQALHGRRFSALTAAERKSLLARFEHDFSDHMPLWVRLPKPG